MSGHSKWNSIKHKKGAADAKRGKIFTRHAKLIEIAAREGGGGDPAMNPRLFTAIENAKADNVPNANIDRAVKKGTGELKGDVTVEVVYEAYGPGGVACIIECLTDNKNRTLNNVRSAIDKRGGKWAESGSVQFMFDRKGVITGEKEGGLNDEQQLELIEAGAEDIDIDGSNVSITTSAGDFGNVRSAAQKLGITMSDAGLKYVPQQAVMIDNAETARKVMDFVENIEEDEDVSEVHTNADFSDEIAATL